MMKPVIIIGASGHGKVVADIIQKTGDQILGFLDDNPNLPETFIGYPVLGAVDDYKKYIDAEFIIGVGNAVIRERLAHKMSGVMWHTAIHPSAVVSNIKVKISKGTVVMANSVINSDSRIGEHCIINSSAVVEHDNRVDDFVHISVGVKLGGTVHVGKSTWIGIGATVSNNVDICDGCMIGAGTVVVQDIRVQGTYVGVPARKIDKKGYSSMEHGMSQKFVGGGVISSYCFTRASSQRPGRAS